MLVYVDAPEDTACGPPCREPRPDPELQPDRWRYYFPWVKTAVGAPLHDDALLIVNRTDHLWQLWHGYHALGPVAPRARRNVRLVKEGAVTARQFPPPPGAEYLLFDLTPSVIGFAIEDISLDEGFYTLIPLEAGNGGVETLPATTPIEELGLPALTENGLKRAGIVTLGEALRADADDLIAMPGFGEACFVELMERIHRLRVI